MAGLGGVSPITVSALSQTSVIAALRPGQVAQGTIQVSEQNLLLRIGGFEIPIEPVAGLAPGQRVSAELIQTSAGTQLRLTPLLPKPVPSSVPVSAGPLPQDLPALLTNVLDSLGRLDAVRQAVHLLPVRLPHSEGAIRLLLSLYFSRSSTGRDLQTIASAVAQAVEAGVLSADDASGVAALIRMAIAATEEDLLSVVRQAGEQAGQSLESRLAAAVLGGTVESFLQELDQDLAVQAQRLRTNDALAGYLRRSGRYADFESAVDRVIERLSAGQVQNLRSGAVPYHFFEVPFDPHHPLRHAQVHLFGEGRGGGRRFDPDNATIVIDLATTRMGDLWITLNTVHGVCHCWIRATDVAVVREVDESAADLAGRLMACGYAGAQVHATLWDGDRLQEAANLMRRFEGINLEA